MEEMGLELNLKECIGNISTEKTHKSKRLEASGKRKF